MIPNRSPNHPKPSQKVPNTHVFPKRLWKKHNPREGGIESGTARFRPSPECGPNRGANPALEYRLLRDLLCTEIQALGKPRASNYHPSTKTRLGEFWEPNICVFDVFDLK